MKVIYATILLVLIVSGCNSQERSVEDDLYQCMLDHYTTNNIDLEISLDSLEDYLITHGVLTSKGGSSKIEYYEKIIRTGIVPNLPETDLMKSISESYIDKNQLVDCLRKSSSFDSLKFRETPFFLTNEKIVNDVTRAGQMSPVTISKAFIKHLTAEDFDKPFYRAHMLVSFVMTNERDKAYLRKVPRKITSNLPNSGGFVIDITTDDGFLVNDKRLQKKEVETALFDYLQHFDASTHVRIIMHSDTPYRQFSEAQLIIDETYKKYWNQVSKREYEKSFDRLSSEEMSGIKTKYPARIIETLPQ